MPKTLDPHEGNFSNRNKITKQIFESLAAFDRSGLPVPSLATKWVINRKEKSIIFLLNKQATFSDGSKLSADDVEFSLRRSVSKDNQLATFIADRAKCNLKSCDSVVREGNFKIKVMLKGNSYDLFIRAIAANEGSIVKANEDTFLGTGPYFVQEKAPNQITLKRRKAKIGGIDQITYLKLPMSDMTSNYVAGKIDELWAESITPEELKKRPSHVVKFGYYGTYSIFLNIQSGIFKFDAARKALSLAVDRKALLKGLKQNGKIAGGYIPAGTIGHRGFGGSIQVAEAKKLINSLPKSVERTVHAIFHHSYKESRTAFIEELRNLFSSLGIKFVVSYSGFTESLKAMKRSEYDLTAKSDSIQYYEPTTIFTPLLTNNFANITHYSNPNLDKIVETALSESDMSKRKELLQQAEEIIATDVPIIPIYYPEKKSYYPLDLKHDYRTEGEIRYWEFPYRNFSWE